MIDLCVRLMIIVGMSGLAFPGFDIREVSGLTGGGDWRIHWRCWFQFAQLEWEDLEPG